MAIPAVFTWPAANTQAICATQTLGAAGSLTINGTLAQTITGGPPYVIFPGISRTVSLTSTNDLSGVNFTITGTYRGSVQTQTIAGPNNNTVYTTATYPNFFDSVTSITTNGAAAAVSVGTGTLGFTHWYNFNYHATYPAISSQVIVTGTPNITYTWNVTLDDIQSNASPATFAPVTAMTTATTSQLGLINTPIRYCAIQITAATTGSLVATFLQQGIT